LFSIWFLKEGKALARRDKLLLYRIIATLGKGMAAEQAPKGQPKTTKDTVAANGFSRIG
jgi:hypothetical protein